MRHINSILTLCLCLTMLVTSVTSAIARGQMAFGQTLVICADGAPLAITLDARGNPVTPAHTCPDCLAVTAGLPPVVLDLAQPLGRWTRTAMQNGASLASQHVPNALARGPPALI